MDHRRYRDEHDFRGARQRCHALPNTEVQINDLSQHPRRLIPPSEWSKYHSWPPLGGLRHLIFNGKSNGFNKVVKRIGRRVLIDEQAFFQWVDKKGGAR